MGVDVAVDEEAGWHGAAPSALGAMLGGLGETSIAVDGRSARSLSLFFRAPSSALVNHAISTSDDGGETWTPPQPLPALVGPTCQGSVGGPPTRQGTVLMSAPNSHDRGLGGRENLGIWALDSSKPASTPVLVGRLWGCKGGYSAFSQDGRFNLFEAGETFRYETIMLAHLNLTDLTSG